MMASCKKQAKSLKKPGKNEGETSNTCSASDLCSQNDWMYCYAEQDRLDRELLWCIEQLRLGIASNGSNDKQGFTLSEATRVLKMLENPSTPVPKKRALMKSTFGDYRKKMADEMKQIDAKSKADSTKVGVQPVSLSDQSRSTFFRKSSSLTDGAADHTRSAAFYCDKTALSNTSSDSAALYAFNFSVSEDTGGGQVGSSAEDCKECLTVLPGLTSGSFQTSETGSVFRFNFGES